MLSLFVICLLPTADQEAPAGWELVWSDEFDGPGPPDPNKWGYEVGMIRNKEAQYYTDRRMKNARVEGGNLVIEAHREPFEGARYTSASLVSKESWTYGRIEVRGRIPTGRGMWPAVWMMPDDRGRGWPACGEIDIMENVGYRPDRIQATIHTKSYNHLIRTHKAGMIDIPKPFEKFLTYTLEWDAERMVWYVDDERYHTYRNDGAGADSWPFDKPFHLKLNVAVGGAWGGTKGIDDSIFPRRFAIDYVRVYRRQD